MTDGERWAAAELGTLRSGRFAPAAWTRFLTASFRRSAETRRSRGALARQARTWSALGLACGLTLAAGARRRGHAAPRPARWAAWWLGTAAMLEWHLGMVEGPSGEPRPRLSGADALTLARLGLVPFIAAQTTEHRAAFAVLLAGAGASDVADGALARRAGPTRLGRDLDQVADVAVGLATVRAARRAGWIRPAVARLALARHALPVAVVSASYLGAGRRPPDDMFATMRPTAPALVGGLTLAPFAPRAAGALVTAASVVAIALAAPRRARTTA